MGNAFAATSVDSFDQAVHGALDVVLSGVRMLRQQGFETCGGARPPNLLFRTTFAASVLFPDLRFLLSGFFTAMEVEKSKIALICSLRALLEKPLLFGPSVTRFAQVGSKPSWGGGWPNTGQGGRSLRRKRGLSICRHLSSLAC